MRVRRACDEVAEQLSIIGRASAAGIPRESATWTRPRMSTEICTTVHYCNPWMANRLCDHCRWMDFGLSGLIGYLQDADQTARHVKSVTDILHQIALKCAIRNRYLGPTALCMTRMQGGVFESYTAAKQCWQGFRRDAFRRIPGCRRPRGGGSHRAAGDMPAHQTVNIGIPRSAALLQAHVIMKRSSDPAPFRAPI